MNYITCAFIGLGKMGRELCARIGLSGFPTLAYDINPAASKFAEKSLKRPSISSMVFILFHHKHEQIPLVLWLVLFETCRHPHRQPDSTRTKPTYCSSGLITTRTHSQTASYRKYCPLPVVLALGCNQKLQQKPNPGTKLH